MIQKSNKKIVRRQIIQTLLSFGGNSTKIPEVLSLLFMILGVPYNKRAPSRKPLTSSLNCFVGSEVRKLALGVAVATRTNPLHWHTLQLCLLFCSNHNKGAGMQRTHQLLVKQKCRPNIKSADAVAGRTVVGI